MFKAISSRDLLPRRNGLGHVLEAVLDRVMEGRAFGLLAQLADDGALAVLDQELQAHPGVDRPAAPGPRGAARLPRAEDVAVDADVAARLDHLEALLIEPLLHVVLALAGRLAALGAVPVVVEFRDRSRLVLGQGPLREVDPV